MAWEVVLIDSNLSPPPEAFAAVVDEALDRIGISASISDEEIFTRDGGRFIFYSHDSGGGMFRLRDFSPTIAEAMFVIADASKSYLVDTSSGAFYRTAANEGLIDGEHFDAIIVDSGDALEAAMNSSYERAEAYTRQVIGQSPAPKPPSLLGRLFGGLFGKAN